MMFTKHLRMGIRLGRIKCSIRIWKSPRVKAGGRFQMDEGQIVVDSITEITVADITNDLARESGFASVADFAANRKTRQRRQGVLDSVPLLALRRSGHAKVR